MQILEPRILGAQALDQRTLHVNDAGAEIPAIGGEAVENFRVVLDKSGIGRKEGADIRRRRGFGDDLLGRRGRAFLADPGHSAAAGFRVSLLSRMDCPVVSQSARKAANPWSVSGCL